MVRLTKALAAASLVAIAISAGIGAVAVAQTPSYKFEPVSPDIAVGKGVRIEVRLLDINGKPVPVENMKVVSTRLDMSPDKMAMMAAPLTALPSEAQGVLVFEAKIAMPGRWALKIKVDIKNSTESIEGMVVYRAIEKSADAKSVAPVMQDRKVRYYRNPMGLADVSSVPKKDSMGMDYIAVFEDEVADATGTIHVSEDKVQRAGIKMATVERRPLLRVVRGAGTVEADEARMATVTAKFSGFVERLDVRTTGEEISAGQPLFSAWIESKDVLRKQADYLTALSGGGPDVGTAAKNLRIFGVSESTIAELARTRRPVRTIDFKAPVSGTVLEKPSVDGMRFEAGDVLFKIADLSSVWVMVDVAEQDLPFVRVGQVVQLSMPFNPGNAGKGIVEFVYSDLDMKTRSGKVRISVPNTKGDLKIGNFVHVEIKTPVGDVPVLSVPVSSVIDDGARRVVFVAKSEGRFEPRNITLGAKAGDFVEIKTGLSEGEKIVVDGIFLIDAESNLQAALAAFVSESVAQ